MRRPSSLFLWILLTCSTESYAQSGAWNPPAPTGHVVDAADILSPATEQQLETRLQDVDDASSVQIAVVSVRDLGGLPARAYAQRLGREWGIGQAGLNNGIVVLIAPVEQSMFVSVGTGLEWQIPDDVAQDVVSSMSEAFQADDFEGGIWSGTERLVELATAVPWDIRYLSLRALPSNRRRAVGAVVSLRGTLSGPGGETLVVGRERVRLRYPPYWMGDRTPGNRQRALIGRIVRAAPMTVQVLGETQ